MTAVPLSRASAVFLLADHQTGVFERVVKAPPRDQVEANVDVIAYGGASFAAALAAQGLIDEYCLAIQPVALGRGQALFAQLSAAQHLELIEARSFACGVVVHIYRPRSR